ncbi:MAG: hypothetical protein ACKOJF_36205 [Planctomycetaceae bacterium]
MLKSEEAGRVAAVVAELPGLYASLESEIHKSNPVCDLSGRCCRFEEYGHTLFVSAPELHWLLSVPYEAGAQVGPEGCPYQVGNICTARERRPLGCRVYFCDPNWAGKGEDLSERYIKQLKDLHDLHQVAWDYRPLHRHLQQAILENCDDFAEDSDSNGR